MLSHFAGGVKSKDNGLASSHVAVIIVGSILVLIIIIVKIICPGIVAVARLVKMVVHGKTREDDGFDNQQEW